MCSEGQQEDKISCLKLWHPRLWAIFLQGMVIPFISDFNSSKKSCEEDLGVKTKCFSKEEPMQKTCSAVLEFSTWIITWLSKVEHKCSGNPTSYSWSTEKHQLKIIWTRSDNWQMKSRTPTLVWCLVSAAIQVSYLHHVIYNDPCIRPVGPVLFQISPRWP